MSADNKDKLRGTIAHLVTAGSVEGSGDRSFFNSETADRGSRAGSASIVPDRVSLLEHLRAADMLVPGSRLGPEFTDEYRRIKRPLLSNAFGKTASLVDRGNLILVTSSVPNEGKTHTSINLALSMAQERDHTVLLVDCDVAKQGVSRRLGLGNVPGLVDVLENDDFTVGDALLRTDIPELTVLCAGKQHEYVTELLASKRMTSLVDEIASRYEDRVIIFDAPPLLPTPQTQVLAGLVGQIVFVIEAGTTPQYIVEEALEMLPDEKAIGLVMNKSEGTFGRSGYYYGYYGTERDKEK
jgi:exopolysaccharide/PEP-CTERM locus tyrosine autokinase